jgi:hypothetical protein
MRDTKKFILDCKPYDLDKDEKDSLFKENLIDELIHHFNNNKLYRQFCEKNDFNPCSFSGHINEIPAIPVHVFKALGGVLNSVGQQEISFSLNSSATSGKPSTILVDKLTAKRQKIAMAKVMQEVLGVKRQKFCIMDINPSSSKATNLGARIAAIKGYLNFSSSSSYFIDYCDKKNGLIFKKEDFLNFIASANRDEPLVIFGFTFVLYHDVIKSLLDDNLELALPAGSKIIHIGGWKKLEDQKVDKSIFNKQIAQLFKITEKDITDIYGFTEQMGINYPDCEAGWKHVPSYSEVLVRDESNHSLMKDHEIGLLQFFSPIPHSYPGNVVLTDDLGFMDSGKCQCGRNTKRFKVVGRAHKAEVRGCGDVMSEKIADRNELNNLEYINNSYKVYHSPLAPLESNTSSLENFKLIVTKLEKSKKWLSEQPTELLLGLIDLARQKWMTEKSLETYRNHGLNFLIDWCSPKKLSALLDEGLRGKRGMIDNFMPKGNSQKSSMMASPRGIVAHWLSGNVPLLGMFLLIQSILCKNINILKVSANESQALPALLESFKGLTYTSNGGSSISGDDLLKTIAVLYFDRENAEIASAFSSAADVRIAWGGKEAVTSITTLPKKYNCQDIIFGPKLSTMVIGKEALSDERKIRKILRRAATDCSVFDQYACASPHAIFIESGGLISPKEFSEKLAIAMEKALIRLPCDKPDIGQKNKIKSKIAEYQFIGEAQSHPEYKWTVLFERSSILDDPTYQRVVTIKEIKNVFEMIESLNEDVQTIGLALEGKKKLDFAKEAANKGIVRCPEIGFMTHFDSPWDGMFAIDRLIRWTSLGGPH